MKCYLHIGTEKTATTTLQDFLHLNREGLLRSGCLFTRSAGERKNFKLAVAAYDPGHRDELTGSFESDGAFVEHQAGIIRRLKDEISAAAAANPDLVVVFSSEHLQSRLVRIEEVQRLRNLLLELGMTDFSVIVYLRNPAEIANSLLSTSLKYGGLGLVPPPPGDAYYSNICHHRNTLEKFGRVFGESALVPRVFHKSAFVNGSIISDFMQVLGIPQDWSCRIPESTNGSLSMLGVHIMWHINRLIPMYVDKRYNPARTDIVSYIERHFVGRPYTMPETLFAEYDREFSASNEWVRRRFFPERERLFPDTGYPEESRLEMSSEDVKTIAAAIADIWIGKHREITRLETELSRIRTSDQV